MQGSITSQGDNDDDDLMTMMTMMMITTMMTMTTMMMAIIMQMIIVSFLAMQSDGQFNILPNELDFPAKLRQNQVNFKF